MPDLTRRSRGAITRLLTSLATRTAARPADKALAAYSAANSLAAALLLATAGFFWYQLFGDLAGTLARRGPAGWMILAAVAAVLGRPAVAAAAARCPDAARTARKLRDTITFRLQWRWRVPAAAQLAAAHPELACLTPAQLGILAGHLHSTRHRGRLPATLAGSYGIIRAGAPRVWWRLDSPQMLWSGWPLSSTVPPHGGTTV